MIILFATGCGNPFKPGERDLKIPQQKLRTIEPLDLQQVSRKPPTTQPAGKAPQPAPPEMKLTIAQVRQLALQNNLDLRVELLSPAVAREGVNEAEAAFEPLLFGNLDYATTDSPTGTRLESSQAKSLRASLGIDFPLITGGAIRFETPFDRFENDNEFSLLNPSYATDALATISHPLLRGFGVETNYHAIRVANYDYQAVQARTKLEVIRILAEAERMYWQLYAARQELELRRKEKELAEAQLERAEREARAGKVAPVETIRAKAGVAEREVAIIIASNQVRERQRALKRIINVQGVEMNSATVLQPVTEPIAMHFDLDAEELAESALQTRGEMLELELRIAAEISNVNFARNQTLPLASLDYRYGINGLGGSFNDSLDVLRDADFQNHGIGLRVEIPLGNQAALSRLRRALLNRLQALSSRDLQSQQIRQEVYDAIDNLETAWQRIVATRQQVIAEANLLDVEIRQFQVGARTSTEVLDAQTRLANARSQEIAAISDYQIAQIDLAFATGHLLGRSQVVWDPAKRPRT